MNFNNEDESTWLSNWEQQCVDSINQQPDYEPLLITDTDNAHRKIWGAFQDSAIAVAELYRDRLTHEPGSVWLTFQTAAGTVTALYKESAEGLRKTSELAVQCGYQKRNKELLNWARKKRRNIQRDDLLAYLAGKPLPPKNYSNHHRASPRPRNISPPPGVVPPESLSTDTQLHVFRDALSRSPLSRRPKGSDLYAFINGEMALHGKRPASPLDVTMSSPTQPKRSRYM